MKYSEARKSTKEQIIYENYHRKNRPKSDYDNSAPLYNHSHKIKNRK